MFLMVRETGAPEETYVNKWEKCKPHTDEPCPTQESNRESSCYKAPVLTTDKPPCHVRDGYQEPVPLENQ